MKDWNLDTIAKLGTATVSFVTLALVIVGFFIGIATDRDLSDVEASLGEDIAQVEAALKEDIAQVEAALKEDIAQVEATLKEDLAQVGNGIAESEARLFGAIESLRGEIRAFNTRIDRHLGGHAE